jgi:hypothetical protein
VWQSGDPILGAYLNGERNNGVYNSLNLGLYSYGLLNPLRVIDPDGRSGEDVLNVLEGYESQVYETPPIKPVSLADQARAVGNLPVAAAEGYANLAALGYAKATGGEFSPVELGRPFSYSDPEAGRAVEDYLGLMTTGGGFGLLGKSAKTAPDITAPYKRPAGATTRAQREAVQGQPCVDCGAITPRQVADHKTPLVKEYYETGAIDTQKMRSVGAVQPHCPTCSAREGADMSRYSRQKKKEHGF